MWHIESLLRKEIGLDAASIGSTLIQRTVRLRMKSLGLSRIEDYRRLVQSSPAEKDELIEAVLVKETWFFRDREPFNAFAQMALQWLREHPAGSLRALSVPCSSGEEPYSLTMALLDVRFPLNRFTMDGVDISSHALTRAKNAVYGRNSFRGSDLAFRERYFHHTKDAYALDSSVRNCVRFYRENLLGEEFLAGFAPYDFIFCRNLLIYFDRATQVRALGRLHHLLAPAGILFVGPAELPLVAGNGFVSANLPMAFACSKAQFPRTTQPGQRRPRPMLTQPALAAASLTKATPPAQPTPDRPARRQASAQTTPLTPPDLESARQLADAGRLEEAIAICESHLRKEGPSAQACCLLGLLHDANGDPRARDYYRKALYLEPNHYETLLHLTLLLEKSGDHNAASSFRSRLRRVEAGRREATPQIRPQPAAKAAEDGGDRQDLGERAPQNPTILGSR